jgi:hypothetical protein
VAYDIDVQVLTEALAAGQDPADSFNWETIHEYLRDIVQELLLGHVRNGANQALRRLAQDPFTTTLDVGGGGRIATTFSSTDPRAVQFAKTRAAELVVEITEQTRAAIRSSVGQAFTEQFDWRNTANLVRGTVGLHSQFARAVANQHADLLANGFSDAYANRVSGAYARRLLDLRARTIARTEIIGSGNAGRMIGWAEAASNGYFDWNAAAKRWVTHEDERTCEYCGPLDGVTIPLDSAFEAGRHGWALMPPVHPNCRCSAVLEIDALIGQRT